MFYLLPGKTKRLKEAKEEAKAEIEGYKSERERQFREHQKEVKNTKMHCD